VFKNIRENQFNQYYLLGLRTHYSDLLSLQCVTLNTTTIMKLTNVKDKKQKPKSWVLPGTSVSQDEFLAGIQEAEEGPFQTVQESMENFEVWLKLREKK
jgi:hypothetical protein